MEEIEGRLIEALQPIRQLFLAQVIYFGMTSGLFDELASVSQERNGSGGSIQALAERLSIDSGRMEALLGYLAVEGIVCDARVRPRLTGRGLDLLEFRPWYELLVGGYGTTLHELPAVMGKSDRYAQRNGEMVGRGSCGISQYDAIPLVARLLTMIPKPLEMLIDLGCGDGSFLLSLCQAGVPGTPVLRGIGIDPDQESIRSACKLAASAGVADMVTFAVGSAEEFVADPPEQCNERACFVAAFSLQEVLGQRGRDAVIELVSRLLSWSTDTHLAVVEVDQRIYDAHTMRHGLATAYYNPYFLLHELTEQRLESPEYWHEVMADAGGEVIAMLNPSREVDSTCLEIGMLIRRQDAR